ncbi:hypothetical protein AMECASPLE_034932 [Ameca splendens]|uniref:Uncharacterized protein n=1 Tax=Ameca splendens TaxID=208324 RepID=A0ABV0ZGB7_9TELE
MLMADLTHMQKNTKKQNRLIKLLFLESGAGNCRSRETEKRKNAGEKKPTTEILKYVLWRKLTLGRVKSTRERGCDPGERWLCSTAVAGESREAWRRVDRVRMKL